MWPRVRLALKLKNKVNRPGLPQSVLNTPDVLSTGFYSEATCGHALGSVRCAHSVLSARPAVEDTCSDAADVWHILTV